MTMIVLALLMQNKGNSNRNISYYPQSQAPTRETVILWKKEKLLSSCLTHSHDSPYNRNAMPNDAHSLYATSPFFGTLLS